MRTTLTGPVQGIRVLLSGSGRRSRVSVKFWRSDGRHARSAVGLGRRSSRFLALCGLVSRLLFFRGLLFGRLLFGGLFLGRCLFLLRLRLHRRLGHLFLLLLRAARRRPAAASLAIFLAPYFFLPAAAATALGFRAPLRRAEAVTALKRLPEPNLGFLRLRAISSSSPPAADRGGKLLGASLAQQLPARGLDHSQFPSTAGTRNLRSRPHSFRPCGPPCTGTGRPCEICGVGSGSDFSLAFDPITGRNLRSMLLYVSSEISPR